MDEWTWHVDECQCGCGLMSVPGWMFTGMGESISGVEYGYWCG